MFPGTFCGIRRLDARHHHAPQQHILRRSNQGVDRSLTFAHHHAPSADNASVVNRLPPKPVAPSIQTTDVAGPTTVSEAQSLKPAVTAEAPSPLGSTAHVPTTTAPAPSPLLDPFRLPTNPVDAVTAAIDVGHWNRAGAKLITASDVDAMLNGDIAKALPRVPAAMHPMVRSLAQALGRDGPLGSHGPLGKLGPAADEPWSPSFWMNKAGDWTELSEKLAKNGGPGSAAGPLGKNGPLGDAQKTLDPALLEELKAGGLFAPLGPLGPLGALGALGYLGLVGGHGYARNEDGQ
jgi:hypothetical protein